MWFDPQIAEDPIWKAHWTGVDAVVVKIAEDSIVLEIDRRENISTGPDNGSSLAFTPSIPEPEAPANGIETVDITENTNGVDATEAEADGAAREKGRVKWFDPDKGYGFLVRPTGEDLFVHHSEVEGDPGAMEPNGGVEYEVGQNDRGPNARRVRPLG